MSAVLVMVMVAWSHPAPANSSAACGPGDRPEPALQGQVPLSERLNGNAADGYWCNVEHIGRYESRAYAAFDTYKNCAYYADNIGADIGAGVIVLDVSDPKHPMKIDYLTARAMRSPGEALRVSQARGLLVADYFSWLGAPNPTYKADGTPESQEILRAFAVYDIAADCTHPKLLADVIMPSAYGHEGCFQPDGMVFYMSAGSITPIDLTDPARPSQLTDPWQPFDPMPAGFHGCSISDDGTRGYFADAFNNQMLIVDTSEVQARKPGAQMRIVGRYPHPAELQQSNVAISYGGHPYLLLFTEAKYPSKVCVPGQPNFGYPRIIDVADETKPVEVSKIQTEVVLPENCAKLAGEFTIQTRGIERGDPINPGVSVVFFGGYDSHFCTPDRLHDPALLACGQLGSGLRVYNIQDPKAPKEIAYYNTGTVGRSDPLLDWAWARPVIRRDLGQIWWTTFHDGFHVAEFRGDLWPATDEICPPGYDYFRAQYDLVYQACKA